ncbi:hypothetical protein BDZ45DRAFT_681636 [Acephala macrosclerotiorum]|nr:hypothetical protein BDZ45DRAFT_681636 [Acephala macrosclerotiorum]
MKQLPPTPHAGQGAHTYGTSSTINMSSQASAPGYKASSGYQALSSDYQASSSGCQAPASDYETGSPFQSRESIVEGVHVDEQLKERSDEYEDNRIEGSVEA